MIQRYIEAPLTTFVNNQCVLMLPEYKIKHVDDWAEQNMERRATRKQLNEANFARLFICLFFLLHLDEFPQKAKERLLPTACQPAVKNTPLSVKPLAATVWKSFDVVTDLHEWLKTEEYVAN